jgi:PII-like signaling protein
MREAPILLNENALRVTVHLNRDTGSVQGFLADDILRLLASAGIGGATVFHAHAGFGTHRRLHTSGAGDVEGQHLPAVIYFVDSPERVEAVLPELLAMVTDGLVEAHRTTILKNVSNAEKVIS